VNVAGDHKSPPRLLKASADGCHFEIIWYTATACIAASFSGGGCQIEDSNSGCCLIPLSDYTVTLSMTYQTSCAMGMIDFI
jgi:hypothetical protein